MTIDMSKYLGLYVTECTEHLEVLGRELVDLEKVRGTPGASGFSELVDSMFRHAHSVKGMSASMGFEATATLAHRIEDLVDAVRTDARLLDRDLVDLLFLSVDVLLSNVRAAGEGRPLDDASELRSKLAEVVARVTGAAPEPTRIAQAVVRVGAAADPGAAGAGASSAAAVASSAAGAAAGTVGAAAGAAGAAAGTAGSVAGAAAGTSVAAAGTVGAAAGAAGAAAGEVGSVAGAAAGTSVAAAGTAGSVAGAAAGTSVAAAGTVGAAAGAVGAAAGTAGSAAAASASAGSLASGAGSAAATVKPAGHDLGLGLPPRFAVKVRIAPSCAVPGVRAFLVHKRLSNLGNIFNLKPALEDLKAGRLPDGLISLELETTAGEAGVAGVLKNVSEVEVVSLKPAVAAPAPPPAAPPAAPEGPKVVGQETARTVRVRTELLDYFLDTAGELLLATARIREVGRALPGYAVQKDEAGSPGRHFDEVVDRLHGLVKDLHDKVMKARMTPLSVITDRLPRAARDIARKRDREIELVVTGAEIELDRAIVDDLADPLLHILRNCIDHGIEPLPEREAAKKPAKGRVLVSVRRSRDRVIIEIEDDGKGMDAGKLRAAAVARGLLTADGAARLSDKEAFLLACLPGVSTAKDVSEISGRGVGMDAVKRAVENVGGAVEIESERGRGTRFTLKLPLTVAVVMLLLVAVGDELYGLPIGKVLAVVEADEAELTSSRDALMLPFAGSLLPVYVLADLLGVPAPKRLGRRPYVVMEGETGKVAFAVDRLLAQEEAVLKALASPLDLVSGLSGVTILGSGRPIFILDAPRLLVA
jgi:two-component system chemotaxis sensor kinase CheA